MDGPQTRRTLAADLGALGVRPGSVLLVHCRMSALGWVAGGAQAVVEALLDAVGPEGTVVVPTHTGENSDPAEWSNPPVPAAWWPVIRAETPAFDPTRSPSRGMGAVPELVRTWPGALRSDHPQTSFAAVGPAAAAITDDHRLESSLGEHSPLARVYDADGDVLLLGVGHGNDTSLHLAQYRVAAPRTETLGARVRGRGWTTWTDVVLDEGPFERLGADLDRTAAVRTGRVGLAEARLVRQRAAVDFAVPWLERHT